jgi:hypothetical protein
VAYIYESIRIQITPVNLQDLDVKFYMGLPEKLNHIRELKSKGAGFEVQAMYEVLDLEKTSILWKKGDVERFEDVLKEESGVCTPSRFNSFKKATGYFERRTIENLGVACVCLLANQNAKTRDRLLPHAVEFRRKFGVEPTYQYFSRFLRKPDMGPSRAELMNYIEDLKKEIRDLGGRVPAMRRGKK